MTASWPASTVVSSGRESSGGTERARVDGGRADVEVARRRTETSKQPASRSACRMTDPTLPWAPTRQIFLRGTDGITGCEPAAQAGGSIDKQDGLATDAIDSERMHGYNALSSNSRAERVR